jgi:hypothetical protein
MASGPTQRKKRTGRFGDLPEQHLVFSKNQLVQTVENAQASEFDAMKGRCERALNYLVAATIHLGSGQAHAKGAMKQHTRELTSARLAASSALSTYKKHCKVK